MECNMYELNAWSKQNIQQCGMVGLLQGVGLQYSGTSTLWIHSGDHGRHAQHGGLHAAKVQETSERSLPEPSVYYVPEGILQGGGQGHYALCEVLVQLCVL
uniref:Uncharacterized protein n=1 Tax=Cacopsylla melanoneura TaxID=428564 RepID=A0A8D8SMK9_9HEMI